MLQYDVQLLCLFFPIHQLGMKRWQNCFCWDDGLQRSIGQIKWSSRHTQACFRHAYAIPLGIGIGNPTRHAFWNRALYLIFSAKMWIPPLVQSSGYNLDLSFVLSLVCGLSWIWMNWTPRIYGFAFDALFETDRATETLNRATVVGRFFNGSLIPWNCVSSCMC